MKETKLDKLNFTYLADIYGPLLTENQRKMLSMFYDGDCSLGEIAQDFEITRQGVRDCVKKAEKTLLDAEAKLGVVERLRKIKLSATELKTYVGEQELLAQIDKIISLTEV